MISDISQTRIEQSDTMFDTAAVLFAFVRAIVSTSAEGTRLEGVWTEAETVTSSPHLKPPKRVGLKVSRGDDGFSVVELEVDRAQVGPHLVELRAYTRDVPSEEEGTLLYTETTTLNSKSPTTWTLRIPVNKFLVIPENDSTVRALARQLSRPNHHATDSEAVYSKESICFAPSPSRLHAVWPWPVSYILWRPREKQARGLGILGFKTSTGKVYDELPPLRLEIRRLLGAGLRG